MPSMKLDEATLEVYRKRNGDFRQNQRTLAKEAFGNVCGCCGYDEHIDVLEFHHVDPTMKSEAVSQILHMPWKVVVDELRKCVLLCPTCHAEVEKGHREIPNFIRRFDESYSTYENSRGTILGLKPWDKQRVCPTCDGPFRARRKSQTYCSKRCVQKRRS